MTETICGCSGLPPNGNGGREDPGGFPGGDPNPWWLKKNQEKEDLGFYKTEEKETGKYIPTGPDKRTAFEKLVDEIGELNLLYKEKGKNEYIRA